VALDIAGTLSELGYSVVGSVSSGEAAIDQAVQLRPDLVLMDIGLPSLNGIDAARQIRKLVPEAKIIFLSQGSSEDVVEETSRLGAQAYVVKANAATELFPAIEKACFV